MGYPIKKSHWLRRKVVELMISIPVSGKTKTSRDKEQPEMRGGVEIEDKQMEVSGWRVER